MQGTKIGWCDHTANLWWGCQEVGPECDRCYARTLAKSKGKARAWEDVRFECPGVWKRLDQMQAAAKAAGEPATVFVQSMGDIFEKPQSLVTWQGEFTGRTTAALRYEFFSAIGDGRWPELVFLLLTKRPGLICDMLPVQWVAWGSPRNVWFGTSVGCRRSLPQIDRLAPAPGTHFVSFEPLLEDLGDLTPFLPSFQWGIFGGESGPGHRLLDLDALDRAVNQLCAVETPVYVKQDSGPREGQRGRIPSRLWSLKQFPDWKAVPA